MPRLSISVSVMLTYLLSSLAYAQFTISTAERSVSVVQGDTARFTVSIASTGTTFATPVVPSANLPANVVSTVTQTFAPESITEPGDIGLKVATKATTPVGIYLFTITGKSGQVSQSTPDLLLIVQAPPANKVSSSATDKAAEVIAHLRQCQILANKKTDDIDKCLNIVFANRYNYLKGVKFDASDVILSNVGVNFILENTTAANTPKTQQTLVGVLDEKNQNPRDKSQGSAAKSKPAPNSPTANNTAEIQQTLVASLNKGPKLPPNSTSADNTPETQETLLASSDKGTKLPPNSITAGNTLEPLGPGFTYDLPDFKTARYRIIAGVSVAAASSLSPEAKFLGDAAVQFPFAGDQDLNSRFWLWGDLRVGSIAQPGALSSIDLSSGLSSYVAPALTTPSQIVQSIELTSGVEWRWWFFNRPHTPMSLSGIVAGGVITPVSPSQFTPTFYVATSQTVQTALENAIPGSKTKALIDLACNTPTPQTCYVAFPPADRTTLFHEYGAGIRAKWYLYDRSNRGYSFPSNFDLIFGQNEYVTGGGLNGLVVHSGGSTTIPGIPGSPVFLFGSFDTRIWGKAGLQSPVALIPAPSGTTIKITDTDVAAIPVPQPNRDRWQIGIGMDLKSIIQYWKAKSTSP